MLSIGPFKDPKITGPSVKETLARELYRIGFPFSLKVPMADCHNLSSPGALLALVTMSCLKLERCKLGLEGNLTPETRKHSDLQNTSCWAHSIHGYHLIRPSILQSLKISTVNTSQLQQVPRLTEKQTATQAKQITNPCLALGRQAHERLWRHLCRCLQKRLGSVLQTKISWIFSSLKERLARDL